MVKYLIKPLDWKQLGDSCWTVDTILGNMYVSGSFDSWHYVIGGYAVDSKDKESAFAAVEGWYYGQLKKALMEVE
jgi:hypothetical protein